MPRRPKFIHPLRIVRKAAGGISQAQLAKLIGVSAAAVQSFELNRLALTQDVALRISEALGVHPATILRRKHKPLDAWGEPYTNQSRNKFKASDANSENVQSRKVAAISNYGLLKTKLDCVFLATLEHRKNGAFLVALSAWIEKARDRFNVKDASAERLCAPRPNKKPLFDLSLEDEAKKVGIEKVQISAPWPEWPSYFQS